MTEDYKRCPRCKEVDKTDFSKCKFCGTKYDWIDETKPEKGVKPMLQSPVLWLIVMIGASMFVPPIREPVENFFSEYVFVNPVENIKRTTKRLSVNPDDYDALVKRGDSYMATFEVHKALDDYTHAIEVNPKRKDAYIKRAVVYDSLTQLDNANRDRAEAEKLH